jgi:hypothetical protein
VTLSCWRKKTKFKRRCSRLNFDGFPKTIGVLLVDRAWEITIGTAMDAKSSNSMAMKLIRFLNSARVDCSVVNTSQTLVVGSTKCPPPSSIFVAINKSLEIQAINLA